MTFPAPSGMRVGVVGTGYLGAVHAVCMAAVGHEVVAIDVDPLRIDALSSAVPPFHEPGLSELLSEALATGRLTFTTDVSALAGTTVVFLCVGTPEGAGGQSDTSALVDAITALAPHVASGTLVVGKSTVPVGTAQQLAAQLAEETRGAARLAWNPEFLREGHAIQDTLRPTRLVYGLCGTSDQRDKELLDRVYADALNAGVPRLVTSLATAELVKGAANAFLATKISFINTVADICEASGADVVGLAEALGLDDRIGPAFLGAGLGFGGGCLPKDIRGFSARAAELGVHQAEELLGVVDRINLSRRSRVVELAADMLGGGVSGRQIAILGFTFKPNSDDLRDSPSLAVARELVRAGANLRLHDPEGTLPQSPGMHQAATIEAALADVDLVVHATEWSDYRSLEPRAIGEIVRARRLIDARNALDLQAWRAAGWVCTGLGTRPHTNNVSV